MKTVSLSDTTTWYLRTIYTDGNGRELNNNKVLIRFDNTKGKVGGKGGCNSFGGSLKMSKDSLQISDVFSTKMFCEEMQGIENLFFKQLEQVNRYKIDGDRMKLYNGEQLLLELTTDK